MAARKKNGQPAMPFEATRERDRFVRIFDTMMNSAAWQDLSAAQRGLYLAFKAEFRPKYNAGNLISENHEEILFPKSSWAKLYGKNGDRSWKRDLTALEEHGFIELRASNKHIRKPNVYALSSKWQDWKQRQPP